MSLDLKQEQKVDWSSYEEIKKGDIEKTKIIEIKQGKLGDFKADKYFEKKPEAKEREAIQIICENGAKEEINLPVTKKITPNSKLGKFKSTYGKYPEINLEINTIVDDNGFYSIVLK